MKKIEALFSSILLIAGVAAQAKTVISYPTIPSKPYTGEVQSPDVPTSLDYELVNAQSGTSVGDYPIYLSLTDPTNTRWPDTDEEIGSTTWSITKAANEWTTEPSIASWNYGDPASTPVATAKFGTPTVTFSGTARDGTTYTDVSSVTKAGIYTCKFTVAGTSNYEGLEPVIKNFEIKVATPGGGGGGGSGNVDISVTGYDGSYDGNDHQISVVITGDDAPTFTVTYSDVQEGPFKSENTYKYKEIGTHTVWYCLQSVNYATVTNSAVVKISQREITPPPIASKEYNGAMQKADVAETVDYTVEYNGEFKEAGTHENAVVLALKDKTHCKWADGAEDPDLLSFTITKSASNVWLTEPSITGWQYGEAAHIPVAVPKYGVVSVLYDGTTTDGTEIKDATAVSKAGSYTAKFNVPETTSYNGLSKNVAFSIERGKIDIGGGGGSGGAKIEVTNYTGTYDGDEHTAAIAVTGDALSSFILTYSLTEAGAYTAEKPSFSNACETTKIWYSVSSPDYQTITNYATVTINQAANVWSTIPTIEGWTYGETAKTPVGAAKFGTVTFTYDPKPVGDAGDYKMTASVAGTANYTALSKDVPFTIAKKTIPSGGDEPGGGEVPPGGLSKYDVTVMYDGEEHTIDTNVLVQAFKTVVVGTIEMQYAIGNGTAWGVELPAWKDVVATSFWYKVTNPNYEDYVHQAKVTITARDISNATIAPIDDAEYAGAPVKPVPTVTDGNPSIITTSDYSVSYANNNAPGTATLTLTGKGNYTGTKSTTFMIVSCDEIWAVFDAMGGLVNGEGVVSQKVSSVYGTLPMAIREGYVLSGWYLGVTNNAPKATDNGAVLTSGTHTLFARWEYDPVVTPDPETIYKWEAIGANTARILGLKNSKQTLSAMALPDQIGGLFVTEIATSAFANSTCGATKLMLPMFCTKIGDKAFLNMPSLKDITFAETRDWQNPSSVALLNIGKYAFSGAKGLISLSLSDAIGSLGDYAFLNTRNLASVTILGKPSVGKQVFRSAGLDTTGVTIHLDPVLASDSAYMASLEANMYNVTVNTDAIVKSLSLNSLSLSMSSVKLTVSAATIKKWNGVNPSALRVSYRAALADEPVTLTPTAATQNNDGTVTLEVATPEGSSGFFQTVLEK